MNSLADRPPGSAVGMAIPHESAAGHVTGTALYTDDLVRRSKNVLHAWPVQAPHARARVLAIDTEQALRTPGVVRVLTASDIPGTNDAGTKDDEPLLPTEVMYHGHAVCWVLAETLEAARLGASAVHVDYEVLDSLLTLTEAIEAGSFQGKAPTVARGEAGRALAQAPRRFRGVFEFGGQEHFYLETHAALAHVDEAGQVFVQSGTQHPSETQQIVAHVLGLASHEVTVQSLRMGGGFGGKEMQPHGLAAIAALGAVLTGRPVRLRLNRTQDITMTGKRHPFHATWQVGFDDDGHLAALQATITADGGWALDLSEPVLSRALCHIENAYYIPHIEVHGRIAKTHKTSQTAFRGFGGPQGMLVIEDILGRCAPALGIEPGELRRRNLYQPGQLTPYGQEVRHADRLATIWAQLTGKADVEARRVQIEAFNAAHTHTKRALAITPVKFGISFNFTAFNQAGALVHVYKDGSVLINHGGTEMGQGLHTKMLQIAATALGVPMAQVRVAPTRTDKVPNTSATAASSGSDLNGGAVQNACEQIRDRLATVAAHTLHTHPHDVRFAGGKVGVIGQTGSGRTDVTTDPDRELDFNDVVLQAYFQRVPLFAAGYYRTEGIHFDSARMQGSPFKYFAYGAAVSEVEVDGFTGAYRFLRTDIVHDVGDSLSPLVDIGQIEGGFVQGAGWLTLEELLWDTSDGEHRGRVTTAGASTYKLPSFSEMPAELNVHLLARAKETGVIYGSKAVGEPPLMLAFSIREALRTAVGAFGPPGTAVELDSPATPEAVFWAIQRARRARGAQRDGGRSPKKQPGSVAPDSSGVADGSVGAGRQGDDRPSGA